MEQSWRGTNVEWGVGFVDKADTQVMKSARGAQGPMQAGGSLAAVSCGVGIRGI